MANFPSKLSLAITTLKNSITHLGLVLTLIFSLTVILIFTYFTTYESAKEQVLDVGGEMFTKVVKDVIGFMEMMDTRVQSGEITLAEAQETVRTYVNGPKKSDGNRDINKSVLPQNLWVDFKAWRPEQLPG